MVGRNEAPAGLLNGVNSWPGRVRLSTAFFNSITSCPAILRRPHCGQIQIAMRSGRPDRLRARYHRPGRPGCFRPFTLIIDRATRPGCRGVAPRAGPPVRRACGIAAGEAHSGRGAIGRSENQCCRCGCLGCSCCGWLRGRSSVFQRLRALEEDRRFLHGSRAKILTRGFAPGPPASRTPEARIQKYYWAHRNPILSLRFPGSSLMRSATRTCLG